MLRYLKHNVISGSFVNNKCFHSLLIEKFARDPYVYSSFNLIASEDPHLDAGPFHKFDSISNLILQLVFNRSGPDEIEIVFDFFRNSGYFFFSIESGNEGLLVLIVPFTIFVLADFFLG
jgi:hypothetical protein